MVLNYPTIEQQSDKKKKAEREAKKINMKPASMVKYWEQLTVDELLEEVNKRVQNSADTIIETPAGNDSRA